LIGVITQLDFNGLYRTWRHFQIKISFFFIDLIFWNYGIDGKVKFRSGSYRWYKKENTCE